MSKNMSRGIKDYGYAYKNLEDSLQRLKSELNKIKDEGVEGLVLLYPLYWISN